MLLKCLHQLKPSGLHDSRCGSLASSDVPTFTKHSSNLAARSSVGTSSDELSRVFELASKWFNDSKGFGFITPDNGGEDLFAHFSEVSGDGFKTLAENQKVSFETKRGPKGMQAANIKPL